MQQNPSSLEYLIQNNHSRDEKQLHRIQFYTKRDEICFHQQMGIIIQVYLLNSFIMRAFSQSFYQMVNIKTFSTIVFSTIISIVQDKYVKITTLTLELFVSLCFYIYITSETRTALWNKEPQPDL